MYSPPHDQEPYNQYLYDSYLEAYNEATALASNDDDKKRASEDADLVDKYNKAKRSKTLVQKHQEVVANKSKKKSKQVKQQPGKEEWVGEHPWKPWDREKDLTAGRKTVNFDSENMTKDLSSRFSSGNFQRNFLWFDRVRVSFADLFYLDNIYSMCFFEILYFSFSWWLVFLSFYNYFDFLFLINSIIG